MIKKLSHWGYYVMATRETAYPLSWRWRIVRRGKPMGVRVEGGGFTTYDAARIAGSRALADFVEQLELESFRID
jgi:ribosomal protein S9